MEGRSFNNSHGASSGTHHPKSHSQSKEGMLTAAMIDLYINMKKRLKSFTSGKFSLEDDTSSANDENAT